jgi:hypothetical protein
MEMIEELVMNTGGYGPFTGFAAGMALKVNRSSLELDQYIKA